MRAPFLRRALLGAVAASTLARPEFAALTQRDIRLYAEIVRRVGITSLI